ncbi:hypothetical protein D3C76_1048720 [compost metagenome]
MLGLQLFLHQHLEAGAVERRIQLVEDISGDASELGGSLPAPVLEIGVLLVVIPNLTAVRARVVRRFRSPLAVHLVEVVLVLVAVQVIETQRVRLATAVAGHQTHTLVGQIKLRVDG